MPPPLPFFPPLGKGMAQKQCQREATARQEGIEAGMVRAKGAGKKKRADKGRCL